MNSIFSTVRFFCLLALTAFLAASTTLAQRPTADAERAFVENSGNGFWLTLIFAIVAVMIGGFVVWRRMAGSDDTSQFDFENRFRADDRSIGSADNNVDLMEELEWFRKAKGVTARACDRPVVRRNASLPTIKLSKVAAPQMTLDSRAFQERMTQLKFAQLPIHSFLQLTEARSFKPLPISADPALLSAIEQASDEFEDDENVRELAIRILAAFRFRNSVESLSQLALYDLSSNLRSKCVSILTEFDHESVFETVLLACADPTREVRAAAARGLFMLSFDRAEAWKRLIQSGDEFRMRQAARAAIESGIAGKSFDRLLHDDMRIAYEAFVLTALLIRSGETKPIIDAIRSHQNDRIRLALLHVIKVMRDERLDKILVSLRRAPNVSDEIREKIDEALDALIAEQA